MFYKDLGHTGTDGRLLDAQETVKGRVRGIIGACSGNLVEWFDFFVYAYTSIYFASAFFPSGNQIGRAHV